MTEQQPPFNLQAKIKSMPDAELPQFTEWLITERYRAQADKVQVKMPLGHFMPADGKKIKSVFNEEASVVPSYTDPQEVEKRLAQVGLFGGNDGAVTFVGPDGRYWVGFESDENMQALEDAGYQKGGVGNIMNADCTFVDPELQEQWEKLLGRSLSPAPPQVAETPRRKVETPVVLNIGDIVEDVDLRTGRLYRGEIISVVDAGKHVRIKWDHGGIGIWDRSILDRSGTFHRVEAEIPISEQPQKIVLTPEVRAQLEPLFDQLRENWKIRTNMSVAFEDNLKAREQVEVLEKQIDDILTQALPLKEDERHQTLIQEEEHSQRLSREFNETYGNLKYALDSEKSQSLFAQGSAELREALRQAREKYQAYKKGEETNFIYDVGFIISDAIDKELGTDRPLIVGPIYGKSLGNEPPLSVEDLSQAFIDSDRDQISRSRRWALSVQKNLDFLVREAQKVGLDLKNPETIK